MTAKNTGNWSYDVWCGPWPASVFNCSIGVILVEQWSLGPFLQTFCWSFDGFPIWFKCEWAAAKWADWNVCISCLVQILNIYRKSCLLRIARSGCLKNQGLAAGTTGSAQTAAVLGPVLTAAQLPAWWIAIEKVDLANGKPTTHSYLILTLTQKCN